MDTVVQNSKAHRYSVAGLRPVTVWIPDSRTPTFAAEAARQSQLVAQNDRDDDSQLFVDSITSDMWNFDETW